MKRAISLSLLLHLTLLLCFSLNRSPQVPGKSLFVLSPEPSLLKGERIQREEKALSSPEKLVAEKSLKGQSSNSKNQKRFSQKAQKKGTAQSSQHPIFSWDQISEKSKSTWHWPWPSYPYMAKKRRLQGRGLVQIQSNRSGEVIDLDFLKKTGHPVLDDEIQETLKTWKIGPELKVKIPIIFQLTQKR